MSTYQWKINSLNNSNKLLISLVICNRHFSTNSSTTFFSYIVCIFIYNDRQIIYKKFKIAKYFIYTHTMLLNNNILIKSFNDNNENFLIKSQFFTEISTSWQWVVLFPLKFIVFVDFYYYRIFGEKRKNRDIKLF